MSGVGVVIPWYQRGPDQWRDNALVYVLDWWRKHHPDWPVALGLFPEGAGPWCKGLAVHQGLKTIDTDIVVVCDADVICEGVTEAVDHILALRAGWAVPHRLVYRMTGESTMLLYQDQRYPPIVGAGLSAGYGEVYPGTAAGGMVVLPRKLIQEIPIDPRFTGWGQEDQAWARALTMIAGHPWRGRSPLYHLWHDPQQRMSRGVGSPNSLALFGRYQTVATLPEMLDLVQEARTLLEINDSPGGPLSEPEVTI